MSYISVFDVLGPVMIGPSSSHTAGAARIAYLAQKLLPGKLVSADFILYGSFAKTCRGHGTDLALLGGILGFGTDDTRLRDSFRIAGKRGLSYSFSFETDSLKIHPNTVDIHMKNEEGRRLEVRGESVGGGKIRIAAINGVEVDFTGEYSTLVVTHQDRMGVAAHITKCLSDRMLNIAFMRLYRDARGEQAYTIVESDDRIPDTVSETIKENPHVRDVIIIQQ